MEHRQSKTMGAGTEDVSSFDVGSTQLVSVHCKARRLILVTVLPLFIVVISDCLFMARETRVLRKTSLIGGTIRRKDGKVLRIERETEKNENIPRLINDVTLDWNETMHRPWLSYLGSNNNTTIQGKEQQDLLPPFMILMTNVGWNHPDQNVGKNFSRFVRERELFAGIVNHPYFHPTAWEEISNGSMPILSKVNYYVFADVMQCKEINYPVYGKSADTNLDSFQNRTIREEDVYHHIDGCDHRHKYDLMNHPLFRGKNANTTNNRLVLFDCRGDGQSCKRDHTDPISVAAIGRVRRQMHADRDQGLIPPAPKPIVLSQEEEDAIAGCAFSDLDTLDHQRPIRAAYVGNSRSGKNKDFHKKHGGARNSYIDFHDPSEGFFFMEKKQLREMVSRNVTIPIRIGRNNNTGTNSTNSSSTINNNNNNNNNNNGTRVMFQNLTYENVLRNTKFAMVPRGDNKFSYRFTEALSAGAIPVYHGDDHVLPFRPELVDWNKCGVLLPEKDAGRVAIETIQNLEANPQTTCAMRKYCYFGIYKKYVETTVQQIDGIVRGLEILAREQGGKAKPFVGTFCNETSIANLDCNPIR